jgi:osmotically-inducible protein OsmY
MWTGKKTSLVSAIGIGALTLLLNSDQSKKRELLRSGIDHLRRMVPAIDSFARGLGMKEMGSSGDKTQGWVNDQELEQRVKETLMNTSNSSDNLEVHARNGNVVLRGDIQQSDLIPILSAIRTIPGVHHVADEMRVLR